VTDANAAPVAQTRVSVSANHAVFVDTGADGAFSLLSDQPTGKVEPPLSPATRPIEHTIVAARAGYLTTYRGVPGSQASGLPVRLLATIPQTAGAPGTAPHVAQYLGDKLAAVTMTFDDTIPSQLTVAKPLFDQYGYKSTFFLTSTYIGPGEATTWAMWQAAANEGYEIGNHGRVHWIKPECTPENDAWNRDSIFGGYDDILANIGRPPLTFAFPGGGESPCTRPLVTESGHVDWRRVDHVVYMDRLDEQGDAMTVSDAIADIDTVLAHTVIWNGATLSWFLFYMHDVTPDRAAVLTALLDYISENDETVWCAGYGEVTVYEREREQSTLQVLQWGARSVTFQLSNSLDPAVFSEPLTVVVPLPPGTTAVQAAAFRDPAAGPVEVRVRSDRLLVNLVPGSQPVHLSW
jgi:oligosaccharide reducing-end xylanase